MDETRTTGVWAMYDKKEEKGEIGFISRDSGKNEIVELTPEEMVDVCTNIFDVMGFKRFFKQLLHNKFRR